MNGPVKMYETRQIIRHDLKVSLLTCMYKINNIHANGGGGSQRLDDDHVSTPKQISNISHQNLNRQQQSDMTTLIDRQEKILQQLDELRQQMITLKSTLVSTSVVVKSLPTNLCINKNKSVPVQISNGKTIVANVSPSHPPYSLLLVRKAWSNSINLRVKTHIHSSIAELSEQAKQLSRDLENYTISQDLPIIDLKLIWKDVGPNTELMISQTPIIGESNILRYLARLTPNHLIYENLKNSYEIDSVLDLCYCLVRSKLKAEKNSLIQNLTKKLGKANWLCDCSDMTIADFAASSAIKQVVPLNEVNPRIAKYLQSCN